MIVECVVCGNSFQRYRGTVKTCSDKCRTALLTRTCKLCGQNFMVQCCAITQSFCSTTCANRHRVGIIVAKTKKCRVCGAASIGSDICSKKCRLKLKRLVLKHKSEGFSLLEPLHIDVVAEIKNRGLCL